MEIKRKIIGILFAILFATIYSSQALAIVDCAQADIVEVGVFPALAGNGASQYIVKLDCRDDTKWSGTQQYLLTSDLGNSGYATVLTAMSLNIPVYVRVESTKWRSLLTLIYANRAATE